MPGHDDVDGSLPLLLSAPYFGRTLESPPGLPGGGITALSPVSGVGARISGSTPEGGHSTPSDLASLSPSGSDRVPVVPSSAMVPRGGTGLVGMHSLAGIGAGGAVCGGGVAGVGGACALAAPDAAMKTHKRNSEFFLRMRRKRPGAAEVPPGETREHHDLR